MPKEASSAVEQAVLQRLSGKRAFGDGGASNGGRQGKEPLGLSKVIGTSKSDQIRPWLTVQEAGSAQPYLYTVAVAVRRKGC